MKIVALFKRFGRYLVSPKGTRQLTVAFHILMILGLVFSIAAQTVVPAFADDPDEPADPGDPIPGDGVGTIMKMFKKIGDLFISVAYSLMIILFAVGTVKSGLAAQAAQQFGATGRVSMEFMNLASGVVIFIIGLISMPLVKWILSSIGGMISPEDMQITMPDWAPIK